MSLDVTIKYKQPKTVDYNKTHTACGSTMMLVKGDYEEDVSSWSSNITGNMVAMAEHIPTFYTEHGAKRELTLYEAVWRPDERKIANTDIVGECIRNGLIYMVMHRKELKQFNPENGWGSYDSFFSWLQMYSWQCEENPDCEIEVWR